MSVAALPRVRDFTRVSDLTPKALDRVLDLAAALKAAPHRFEGALRGDSVACLFEASSTRERVSFAAAAARLGAGAIALGPHEVEIASPQALADAARGLSGHVAAIVVGAADQRSVDELVRWASVPVVNAASDEHHPCQALADLLTIRELFGTLAGRRLAFVGDGAHGVARSLLEAGALAGMDVTLACPRAHRPDDEVLAAARRLAGADGVALRVVSDPAAAVAGADVVYAGAWRREAGGAGVGPYQVTHELMTLADADAIFLHCLPARRGEEVAAAVIDGAQSAVWRQSANLVPTGAALLLALVKGFGQETPPGRAEALVASGEA